MTFRLRIPLDIAIMIYKLFSNQSFVCRVSLSTDARPSENTIVHTFLDFEVLHKE